MSLIEYRSDLVEAIAARLELRDPNRRALDAVAKALGDATDRGVELVCDLATGTGKTYIAAGLVDYLAESGSKNVLFVCHRNAIRTKTQRNFTPGDRKFVSGLEFRPEVVTIDDFRQQRTDLDQPTLYLFNVQQLLRPRGDMERQTREYDEVLGDSLYGYLAGLDDLVVIADEHHMYFGPEFSRSIRDLNALATIGLTATPHRNTPDGSIIFRYALAEAIADGYVKIPVLVGRRDGTVDLHRVLADGIRLLDTKQRAVDRWCEEKGVERFNAVMFVVCESIAEAEDLAATLERPEYLGSSEAVLSVNSSSPDEALALLDGIEEPGSTTRAVVSVQMLQEGWDVRNIYVVATTRALESKALSEQILGRGLRLPFGERTGQQMLDTVEVLSHRRFREILAGAAEMLEAFFNDQQTTLVPTGESGGSASGLASMDHGRVDVLHPPTTSADGSPAGDESAFGLELVDADTRIAELDEQAFRFTQTIALRSGAPRFRFPRLVSTLRPAVFNLSDFRTSDAEEIGRRFTAEIAATLQRELIDVERVEDGTRIAARAAEDVIEATQLTLGMDDLRAKIQQRVLDSRYVERTRTQVNALKRIVGSFLTGAGADDNAQWGEARVRAAVEAVLGYVQALYRNRPPATVEEVELVDYPRIGVPAPAEVHNKSTVFVAKRWYDGWNRNLLPVVRFDAKSTEFALAEILDTDDDITWWCRVETHQEVAIAYDGGNYYPDLIAVDGDGTHWLIEGKADSKVLDADVVAKRTAAERWTRYVNDSGDAPDTWRYMFAPEAAIKGAAGSWTALISLTNPV